MNTHIDEPHMCVTSDSSFNCRSCKSDREQKEEDDDDDDKEYQNKFHLPIPKSVRKVFLED